MPQAERYPGDPQENIVAAPLHGNLFSCQLAIKIEAALKLKCVFCTRTTGIMKRSEPLRIDLIEDRVSEHTGSSSCSSCRIGATSPVHSNLVDLICEYGFNERVNGSPLKISPELTCVDPH